jgi:uncharacterized protein (DUF2147 family)
MSIDKATHLWFEAGDMSGGSRNQVEFSEEMVRFFDEESRASEQVFIAYDTTIKEFCALTNRGQNYGQWTNIWRLGLITKAKGGVEYQGRVICLEKRKIGQKYVYVIAVVDPNSSSHKDWISKSVYSGTTGGTGGRAFGYF